MPSIKNVIKKKDLLRKKYLQSVRLFRRYRKLMNKLQYRRVMNKARRKYQRNLAILRRRQKKLLKLRRLQYIRRLRRSRRLKRKLRRVRRLRRLRRLQRIGRLKRLRRKLINRKIRRNVARRLKAKVRSRLVRKNLQRERMRRMKKRLVRSGMRSALKLIPRVRRKIISRSRRAIKHNIKKLKVYQKILKRHIRRTKKIEKRLREKESILRRKIPDTKFLINVIKSEARSRILQAERRYGLDQKTYRYVIKLLADRLKRERKKQYGMLYTANLLRKQIIAVMMYRDRLTNALNKVYDAVALIKKEKTR